MSKSEELKQTAQLRKAILPLVTILKAEANQEITKRLGELESLVQALADKELSVSVNAPEVTVQVPVEQIVAAIEKQTKATMQKASPVAKDKPDYQPHDQAKSQTFQYSGFMSSDGAWRIQRVTKGEQRYAHGQGGYTDAWEKRSKLKYGYLNESA